MGRLLVLSPPATTPVTLDHCRGWGRLGINEDDVLLACLLQAVGEVERYAGRSLIQRSYELRLHEFPLDCHQGGLEGSLIELPNPPLVSVSSITYVQSKTTKTLAAGDYVVTSGGTERGIITPRLGTSWPATDEVPDAVRISFVAGFGTSPDSVPQSLRNGVMAVAVQLFESRGQMPSASLIGETLARICGGFRRLGVA
jgi:uncharacterized phiE125 gp8 family phage protein